MGTHQTMVFETQTVAPATNMVTAPTQLGLASMGCNALGAMAGLPGVSNLACQFVYRAVLTLQKDVYVVQNQIPMLPLRSPPCARSGMATSRPSTIRVIDTCEGLITVLISKLVRKCVAD